ncbi:MAG: LemA family protein [Planctomycetota bacterium]|nr:LemA family protein [Planctomycetota bacterium]
MIPILVVVGIIVLLLIVVVSVYNGLVQKRMRCQEGWSQIDVQLKRRYDLIPNLVETVKGYAGHEKSTLEAVINARSRAMGASGVKDQAEAENMLSGALRQLFALQESYPNLKANENFSSLQEELTGTENKIAFSRQHYNDTVSIYNTSCQTFPNNMIAGMFGFKEREFFQGEEAVKQAPKVSF